MFVQQFRNDFDFARSSARYKAQGFARSVQEEGALLYSAPFDINADWGIEPDMQNSVFLIKQHILIASFSQNAIAPVLKAGVAKTSPARLKST